jgi:ammonia channel protein AmtB
MLLVSVLRPTTAAPARLGYDACANRTAGTYCVPVNTTDATWISLTCDALGTTDMTQVCGTGCNPDDGQCVTSFAGIVAIVALVVVVGLVFGLVAHVVVQGLRMARHMAAVQTDMAEHGLIVEEPWDGNTA